MLAIVATMALNVNFSAKNNILSDITLANIEALAKSEGGDDGCCYFEASWGWGCTSSSDYAASQGGYFCCNTAYAKEMCHC